MTKKFLQYKKKYLKLKGGSCKNNDDDDEEANLYVTDDDDDEHVENSNVILQPKPEEKHENPERRYRTIPIQIFNEWHAPLEPSILLANHFTINSNDFSLEDIRNTLEDYLTKHNEINFSFSYSSCRVVFKQDYLTSFIISIYRSKVEENEYIMELAHSQDSNRFSINKISSQIKELFNSDRHKKGARCK